MNDKISLTIQDVSKTTGIGRTKVFELIREGKLPARKIGTRTIILAEDLKAFLDKLPQAGHRPA
ncbi:MAG: helix-turn-helix domain-containing protein [Beijerinckiaceae bacterium]|nr:helix-turn-helix domain-containing protein [Beijerinckiaceae bacterium]MCZ8300594.1 helix-turn-helix domain-containing protein [Beijerinckiaceae bacterium]